MDIPSLSFKAAPATIARGLRTPAPPGEEGPAPSDSVKLSALPALPAEEKPVAPATNETRPARQSEPTDTAVATPQGRVSLTAGKGGALTMEFAQESVSAIGQVEGFTLSDGIAQAAMRQREKNYLARFPYSVSREKSLELHNDLLRRYSDSRVLPDRVHEVNHLFAEERGIDLAKVPPGLNEFAFDGGTLDMVKGPIHRLAEAFFNNPRASQNPEKCRLVKEQSDRYLDLLVQAAQEGDPHLTGRQLSCSEVYKLVSGNIAALALQDRAAAEAAMGDHGVRHLVGHNIRVCETMADEMQKHGALVTAKDRLILHQAMILHDLGYSTQNVRGSINREGVTGQDIGHPVLAGRYLRERFENIEDPLRRVFSPDDMGLMHRCVLYHDMDQVGQAGLDFRLTAQPTLEDRGANLESLTRVADNTHAFEDKLPEFIYRNPSSLVNMRLLKAAADLGETETVDALKARLKSELGSRQDLSPDDRQAMGMAVDTMLPIDVDFCMRRVLGNEPQYALDASGKVHLTVQESGVHKEVSELSGQQRYRLLRGWIKDISGLQVSEINPEHRVLENDKVRFTIEAGGCRAEELTPFQQELRTAFVDNPPFSRWAAKETQLARVSQAVDDLLSAVDLLKPEQLREAASSYTDIGPSASAPEVVAALHDRAVSLKRQRHDLLHAYLGQS